jgi:hypothetical protein
MSSGRKLGEDSAERLLRLRGKLGTQQGGDFTIKAV